MSFFSGKSVSIEEIRLKLSSLFSTWKSKQKSATKHATEIFMQTENFSLKKKKKKRAREENVTSV